MTVDLRFDQDEIDKEDDKVMLYIFVAEPTTVLAHRQPDIMPTGLVSSTRVLRPQRRDWVSALNADGHGVSDRMVCVETATTFGSSWWRLCSLGILVGRCPSQVTSLPSSEIR